MQKEIDFDSCDIEMLFKDRLRIFKQKVFEFCDEGVVRKRSLKYVKECDKMIS